METLRFINCSSMGEVQTLNRFAEAQSTARQRVEEQIGAASRKSRDRFRLGINNIIETLKEQIHKSQEDAKDNKNQEEVKVASKSETITTEQGQVLEKIGFKPDLKYGPKSKLRVKCSRFLRFSYILDFLAMEALS